MWQKLLNLDRRFIFIVVAAVLLLGIVKPMNIPGLTTTEQVRSVYDYIESLSEGDRILLSYDFDPGSRPELEPMAYSITKHCFKKNLKVIAMNLWVTGTTLAEDILRKCAKDLNKKYEEDYVFLGWKPIAAGVITGMGNDWYKVYPTEYYGKDLKSLPIMKDIRTLADIKFLICFNAGDPGTETWITYGSDVYKFNMAAGCTSVITPQLVQFYNSKQLRGLVGGIRGAAEYEELVKMKGRATAAMDAISLIHFFIIATIILANVAYFISKRKS